MIKKLRSILSPIATFAVVSALVLLGNVQPASALTPIPTPDPVTGSHGLEATKTQAPPTQGATITTPGSGAAFQNSPISVGGICPNGLLVQLYNNGVMVGSVMCENGSFSIEISLFAGINELTARVFDDLDQAGPDSNIVTITYSDTRFSAFGELITLTSAYGRRSAAPESQLFWPLQLSGGTGPYAFSIDWGDGSDVQLVSQSLAGVVNIAHSYRKAGIYQVNVRVADTNEVGAFLQLIAVSSGQVDETTPQKEGAATPKPVVLWAPAAFAIGLLFPSFWLGRRSQLISLRNKMLKERDSYQQK